MNRRGTVEQIARDEKKVQFEPGDSYLLSYLEFVAYFANVNGSYNQAKIQKPGNYLAFLDNCREIARDGRFEAVHVSMNRKIGYVVSPFRALELVMYWNGNR